MKECEERDQRERNGSERREKRECAQNRQKRRFLGKREQNRLHFKMKRQTVKCEMAQKYQYIVSILKVEVQSLLDI